MKDGKLVAVAKRREKLCELNIGKEDTFSAYYTTSNSIEL